MDLAVATLICASSPVARADTFTVAWAGSELTVVAADAPLAAVLSEVGRQTGVTFVGLDRVTDLVTMEIRDARLYDALATLLDGRSYVMTKPAEPDAVVVWLEGRLANRVLTDVQRTTRAIRVGPPSDATAGCRKDSIRRRPTIWRRPGSSGRGPAPPRWRPSASMPRAPSTWMRLSTHCCQQPRRRTRPCVRARCKCSRCRTPTRGGRRSSTRSTMTTCSFETRRSRCC